MDVAKTGNQADAPCGCRPAMPSVQLCAFNPSQQDKVTTNRILRIVSQILLGLRALVSRLEDGGGGHFPIVPHGGEKFPGVFGRFGFAEHGARAHAVGFFDALGFARLAYEDDGDDAAFGVVLQPFDDVFGGATGHFQIEDHPAWEGMDVAVVEGSFGFEVLDDFLAAQGDVKFNVGVLAEKFSGFGGFFRAFFSNENEHAWFHARQFIWCRAFAQGAAGCILMTVKCGGGGYGFAASI